MVTLLSCLCLHMSPKTICQKRISSLKRVSNLDPNLKDTAVVSLWENGKLHEMVPTQLKQDRKYTSGQQKFCVVRYSFEEHAL